MKKLIESKITAWVALLLVVTLIVISFLMHTPWWGFIAIFFAFLAIFCHLASLYIKKMSRHAASTLELIALNCGIAAVVAVVVEWIVWHA